MSTKRGKRMKKKTKWTQKQLHGNSPGKQPVKQKNIGGIPVKRVLKKKN